MVEVGFLNFSSPRFSDVVTRLVACGTSKIVVVPYFLVAGKFVCEDLSAEIAKLRVLFPQVEFLVAEPFGYDPLLAEILLDLAANALPHEHWRDDLLKAADFCEERQDCSLYGAPPCKASAAQGAHL
jgi:sirohydrochlorin cobaltochelatase